jgi:hypothetical protein
VSDISPKDLEVAELVSCTKYSAELRNASVPSLLNISYPAKNSANTSEVQDSPSSVALRQRKRLFDSCLSRDDSEQPRKQLEDEFLRWLDT